MPPLVAKHMHLPGSNKEGWIDGIMRKLLSENKEDSKIELSVAFPVIKALSGLREEIEFENTKFMAYGFYEDVSRPEIYDPETEETIGQIIDEVSPDVIHIFGSEFGHAYAAVQKATDRSKVLIGIQGLISLYAKAYMSQLPKRVINRVTFRDIIKRDSIKRQQEKFFIRGDREIKAIEMAGNITGRTPWDHDETQRINPGEKYYKMNETLRGSFYEDRWNRKEAVPHTIFMSQGDYPIKGLHFMLLAIKDLKVKYPDIRVNVAGNVIIRTGLLSFLKESSYGKYIKELINKYDLWDNITFLGRLSSEEMKAEYLKANVYVCSSSIENSPNSLGEAMILGVPCVAADVGGVRGIFDGENDGILYEGSEGNLCLEEISENLRASVEKIFESSDEELNKMAESAIRHAGKNHDPQANYDRLIEIYKDIANRGKQ
ncbi:MAG: glycosyltransferase family 4 protein [Acetatifactor sp.]|nr:glycosyltransferase family 4 protein [Acetatifactor sp.]